MLRYSSNKYQITNGNRLGQWSSVRCHSILAPGKNDPNLNALWLKELCHRFSVVLELTLAELGLVVCPMLELSVAEDKHEMPASEPELARQDDLINNVLVRPNCIFCDIWVPQLANSQTPSDHMRPTA
jgi:hypothetical protein